MGAPVRLYLASTSPARLATLRAAGIEPAGLISPGVDEDAVVDRLRVERAASGGSLTPHDMVLELARAKAEAVQGQLVEGEPIDGFVLGGDSAFEFDGEVYGKPHEPAVARERWLAMRGRSGVLHSGHWILDHRSASLGPDAGGSAVECAGAGVVDSAEVHFSASVGDHEIDAYVATGEPLEVAGAFTIDSRGAAFIDRVSGSPSAVVGLSVPAVRSLLRDAFGVSWHELWNR
ncbi:Maf family protein [Ruicaihuangia caeni]|uniref:Nucleoside triphosphate pyrophosphatase n=1 Tax=Ruicaihuangia caeni TaxID=3042517 RepID=A0AAW6TAK7_9MICO|nr:nucleoside triphosphate pyrophosphatase [Klugiella sp. YN-L-19]MDI2099358.1 nucleoside triphosphate pyrophosphatase [Klugiella sp. YN-L-19]